MSQFVEDGGNEPLAENIDFLNENKLSEKLRSKIRCVEQEVNRMTFEAKYLELQSADMGLEMQKSSKLLQNAVRERQGLEVWLSRVRDLRGLHPDRGAQEGALGAQLEARLASIRAGQAGCCDKGPHNTRK